MESFAEELNVICKVSIKGKISINHNVCIFITVGIVVRRPSPAARKT